VSTRWTSWGLARLWPENGVFMTYLVNNVVKTRRCLPRGESTALTTASIRRASSALTCCFEGHFTQRVNLHLPRSEVIPICPWMTVRDRGSRSRRAGGRLPLVDLSYAARVAGGADRLAGRSLRGESDPWAAEDPSGHSDEPPFWAASACRRL
jgi:hypothetical protein